MRSPCTSSTRLAPGGRSTDVTTTIRPPRFFRARSRAGKSGTVIRLPLEAIGLAPKTRKYDVRSMSGIGIELITSRKRGICRYFTRQISSIRERKSSLMKSILRPPVF